MNKPAYKTEKWRLFSSTTLWFWIIWDFLFVGFTIWFNFFISENILAAAEVTQTNRAIAYIVFNFPLSIVVIFSLLMTIGQYVYRNSVIIKED